jgi:hypothetical protein
VRGAAGGKLPDVKTPFAVLVTAGVFGALALSAVACSATSASQTPAAMSFQDCLRNGGITLPSNGFGRPDGNASARPTARPSGFPTARPSGFPTARPSGGTRGGFGNFGDQAPAGVDPQKWQAALQKCASLRPSGNPSRGPRSDGRDNAYRNCLSEHGVNPLDPSDPKLPAAAQACAVLSPSPR